MKCNRFAVERLRNQEWFQFYTEYKALVEQHKATALSISALFKDFLALYADADKALEIIRKSATTEKLAEADTQRDNTLRGFNNAAKAMLNHFDPLKVDAAKRLQIVINTYGDMARKYYDEQTASIYNFMQEMKGKYAADITLLNLNDWTTQLEADNKAFDTLMKSRYSDDSKNTNLRLQSIRTETDRNYRDTLDRLDALILINGAIQPQSTFIIELNTRSQRYENILAQRQGRAAAKKENKEQGQNNAP